MKFARKGIFSTALLMMLLCVTPAYASENDSIIQSENAQQSASVLLPSGTVSSRDEISGVSRSSIVSSASSEIIDETGGNIGVVIETLCHIECDEIRNIAILERYDEETDNWLEMSRYTFIALKEDFPNTSLTSLTNTFTIENQKTGYYYRIRGIHSVVTPDGSGQVYTTRTNGLLITEYGR